VKDVLTLKKTRKTWRQKRQLYLKVAIVYLFELSTALNKECLICTLQEMYSNGEEVGLSLDRVGEALFCRL
jgi:hypothetical protein